MFWTEIRSHHFGYPFQQTQLEVSYQTLKDDVLHLDLLICQQDYLWTTSAVGLHGLVSLCNCQSRTLYQLVCLALQQHQYTSSAIFFPQYLLLASEL